MVAVVCFMNNDMTAPTSLRGAGLDAARQCKYNLGIWRCDGIGLNWICFDIDVLVKIVKIDNCKYVGLIFWLNETYSWRDSIDEFGLVILLYVSYFKELLISSSFCQLPEAGGSTQLFQLSLGSGLDNNSTFKMIYWSNLCSVSLTFCKDLLTLWHVWNILEALFQMVVLCATPASPFALSRRSLDCIIQELKALLQLWYYVHNWVI